MNPRVESVESLADYRLLLHFTNGEERIFDAAPYLSYPIYRPLSNPARFSLATAAHGTVIWPGEVDFCPDTLYLESRPANDNPAANSGLP